jgi:hypothetical protein
MTRARHQGQMMVAGRPYLTGGALRRVAPLLLPRRRPAGTGR